MSSDKPLGRKVTKAALVVVVLAVVLEALDASAGERFRPRHVGATVLFLSILALAFYWVVRAKPRWYIQAAAIALATSAGLVLADAIAGAEPAPALNAALALGLAAAWLVVDWVDRMLARRRASRPGRRWSTHAPRARKALAWLILAAFAAFILLSSIGDSEAVSVAGVVSVLVVVFAAVALAALVLWDRSSRERPN